MDNYEILHEVSKALYGSIYIAKVRTTGELVAIKEMNLASAMQRLSLREASVCLREDIFLERAVNRLFSSSEHNPHIVHMTDDFIDKGCLYMVLEYCAKGDLYELMNNSLTFAPSRVQSIFYQIVSGLNYIHQCGYAHRDLSLENVLVDANDTVKICDFGVVAQACQLQTDRVGKFFYLAPEVHDEQVYNPVLADLWSLGVMLFVLLTGTPPIEKAHNSDPRYKALQRHGVGYLIKHWKLEENMPQGGIDLIENLMVVEPTDRMPLEEVKFHPWLAGFEEKHIEENHPTEILKKEDQGKIQQTSTFMAILDVVHSNVSSLILGNVN